MVKPRWSFWVARDLAKCGVTLIRPCPIRRIVAPRDGAAITGEAEVKVTALGEDAEVVLVDAI